MPGRNISATQGGGHVAIGVGAGGEVAQTGWVA